MPPFGKIDFPDYSTFKPSFQELTMFRLFLLFTIVPATELWLLFQVGNRIGILETIWLILITGVVGAGMAKREGVKVIHDLKASMHKGQPPGTKIIEGILVLVGGLLLITPGILTDLFGFSLIFPFTRTRLAPLIHKAAEQSMHMSNANGDSIHFGPMSAGPSIRNSQEDGTINVEMDSPSAKSETNKIFKHPTF